MQKNHEKQYDDDDNDKRKQQEEFRRIKKKLYVIFRFSGFCGYKRENSLKFLHFNTILSFRFISFRYYTIRFVFRFCSRMVRQQLKSKTAWPKGHTIIISFLHTQNQSNYFIPLDKRIQSKNKYIKTANKNIITKYSNAKIRRKKNNKNKEEL